MFVNRSRCMILACQTSATVCGVTRCSVTPDYDGHEALLFAQDTASGLRAMIAIHDTTLGPAFGGCRMYPCASEQHAMTDVLRLSRGMTYKAAICELPYGGGDRHHV